MSAGVVVALSGCYHSELMPVLSVALVSCVQPPSRQGLSSSSELLSNKNLTWAGEQ